METISYSTEKNSHKKSSAEEEEEEEEKVEEDEKDTGDKEDVPLREESGVQKQQRSWAPSFFYKMDKEVYHFVGQDIIIQEALDSFAAMTWPAASALCQYLESHNEELNLVDKAVLEIGSGTGLVAIVAALLGAWVTATDLPDAISNLRLNLSRNTRGKCRHSPQVETLSWGYDLGPTYPTSVYRYDYVLGADIVYHHDFRDELLATMKHFCQPGTTLLWANKIRMVNDLEFAEKFKKTFNTKLLVEDGDMRIFMATYRDDKAVEDGEVHTEDINAENINEDQDKPLWEPEIDDYVEKDQCVDVGSEVEDALNDIDNSKGEEIEDDEHYEEGKEDDNEEKKEEPADSKDPVTKEDTSEGQHRQKNVSWTPNIICSSGKDVYHYVGTDIVIYESIEFYGAVMWPAALALCSFLENNTETVSLEGKLVLELGAGTGLVAIVASLLGAAVTATDLPDILGNLRANVMRNTRGKCTYVPQIWPLTWSFDVGRIYPANMYRYDYVLAADVVYHHDFLEELMSTMIHFCHPRTTIIWANKIRMVTDIEFSERFKKEFNTTLLAENGDMKIFMGTFKM